VFGGYSFVANAANVNLDFKGALIMALNCGSISPSAK
jgi:hypothetical protein